METVKAVVVKPPSIRGIRVESPDQIEGVRALLEEMEIDPDRPELFLLSLIEEGCYPEWFLGC